MAAKHDKGKRQMVALMQEESTRAYNMVRKPEVPAYDAAMVKRCETVKRARKTVYRAAKPATLVKTGITVGSWDKVGTSVLIKRHK
jgi:hypothetical protein